MAPRWLVALPHQQSSDHLDCASTSELIPFTTVWDWMTKRKRGCHSRPPAGAAHRFLEFRRSPAFTRRAPRVAALDWKLGLLDCYLVVRTATDVFSKWNPFSMPMDLWLGPSVDQSIRSLQSPHGDAGRGRAPQINHDRVSNHLRAFIHSAGRKVVQGWRCAKRTG